MTGAALAGLVLALAAGFVRASLWHAPVSFFSYAMALRPIFGAFVTAFVTGSLAAWLGPGTNANASGLAVGGTLGLLFLFLSSRRSRFLRGAMLCAFRLASEDTRAQARVALRENLRVAKKRLSAAEYARVALMVTNPLTAVSAWDDAAEVLDSIEPADAIGKDRVAQRGQALATVSLHRGDLERARSALSEVPRPADEAIERWLIATEALLDALCGGVERALSVVGERDDPEQEPGLRASYAIVRAHAFACRGDEKGAERELRRVIDVAGLAALERAVHPVGPATDLARELCIERGAEFTEVDVGTGEREEE